MDKSTINEYISKNKNIFDNIARDKNVDKELINSAHFIVKKFIIDRKLIIFGGLSIDYSLRLKGSSIYSDNELPDYDCLSDTNVDDAYDLGDILFNMGFENVKIIRAKHIETMRVRINLITILDIGYMPSKYYNKLNTLLYDGLRILHPNVQRLDLHRAFCFPLNNAPMEDIFHRWEKDIYRFNLYEKYYPMNIIDIEFINKSYQFTLPIKFTDKNYAFHGFAAYALLCKELLKHTKLNDIPILEISFSGGNICNLTMPCKNNIILVTDTEHKDKINYSTILNLIPESYVHNNVTIYYTDLLSINKTDNNINIVNIQYLLLYFLFFSLFDDDEYKRKVYNNYYIYTLKMIEIAEQFNNINLFMPSINYLGKKPLYIPNELLKLEGPVNYNPYKIGTRRSFDYSFFKLSGEKLN